jgi:hypothetical protein
MNARKMNLVEGASESAPHVCDLESLTTTQPKEILLLEKGLDSFRKQELKFAGLRVREKDLVDSCGSGTRFYVRGFHFFSVFLNIRPDSVNRR